MTDEGRDKDRKEPLGDLAAEVRERTGEADDGPERSRRDGPLADVAAEVDERKRRRRSADDLFESVEVGEVDGEKLWDQLAEGSAEGAAVSVPSEGPDDSDDFGGFEASEDSDDFGDFEDFGEFADRDVRTIPKATCHGCPHLADPPELACTHEGTDILEMPDSEHFRVADCPMVVDDDEEFDPLGAESDDAVE